MSANVAAIFLYALGLISPSTQDESMSNTTVVVGDFISLPGGRGNIAEFGKALRLDSFSERNTVQFHRIGEWFHHRFIFENTSRVLEFEFKFGETHNKTIHGKVIEYIYAYEPTADPNRATIFATYQEIGGDIRFTVEATFTRTGMTVTYTHADVLDNIMARRKYKRVIPKRFLGYYENDAKKESKNYAKFASVLPRREKGQYTSNSKLSLMGPPGESYRYQEILDPETMSITYPFFIGEKQKIFVEGKALEYSFNVYQTENSTVIKGEFVQTNGDASYTITGVFDGEGIDMTYSGNNVVATRHYKRALPIEIYGKFESLTANSENYTEFSSVFLDPVLGSESDAGSRVRFYRKNGTYHQEIINILGSKESVDIPFHLGVPVSQEIGGKNFEITYTYDGGENPILFIHFVNTDGDLSFKVRYTVDARGIEAFYRRETSTASITARRFFRRRLPSIVFGRYESIGASPNFNSFAYSIHFPEITRNTITEYAEANDSYVQRFQYGIDSPFTHVPFTLGESHDQLVKSKWWMEYTYYAYEGERTFLISIFKEKFNNGSAPTFQDFIRIGDFDEHGYNSTYLCGNVTASRIYRRLH